MASNPRTTTFLHIFANVTKPKQGVLEGLDVSRVVTLATELSAHFRAYLQTELVTYRKRCGGDGAGFELTIGAAADPAAKPLGW
jgi:hypothetical protein